MYKVIASNEEQEEYIRKGIPNRNLDKSGMIFGNLKVIGRNKDNHLCYDCLCLACNSPCVIENRSLTLTGKGKSSCGCKRRSFLGKKKDENYFEKIDRAEKAYFLGFIAADGSVYKSKRSNSVTLSIRVKYRDKDILEKFKESIKSDIEIKEKNPLVSLPDNKKIKTHIAVFNVTSKKMGEDLFKLGIIPNKTKQLKMNWKLISSDFMRDFIRGFLDGDGTYYVRVSKNGLVCPTISVGSCLSMVEDLKDILDSFGYEHWHINDREEDNFYDLRNNSKYEFLKFRKEFYYDNCVSLDRKRKKVERIEKLILGDLERQNKQL